MKRILISLPEKHIELLDNLVNLQFYPNRNEAIRMAVRELLNQHRQFSQTIEAKKRNTDE
jgi:Arc/MetJ-type ribon-helix-helix transcriptional regulator